MDELLMILQDLNPEVDFMSETALIDKEILDSFDIVTLVAELDDRFGILVSAEDLIPENFNSAGAIWNLILRLQNS